MASSKSNLSNLPYYMRGIDRQQTEAILGKKKEGVFLIRDSRSIVGDYVLSVSEKSKVSHYIINNRGNHFQIGENTFPDIPAIVDFYKRHLLETTTLVESANVEPPCNIRVKALYNFAGNDVEDLPFTRHEFLTVIGKPEDNWWRAKNSRGKEGLIPVPYIKVVEDTTEDTPSNPPTDPRPALSIAIQTRVDPYDPSQLEFDIGDIILVTEQNVNGTWFGKKIDRESCRTIKEGYFPFRFVKLVDENDSQNNGLQVLRGRLKSMGLTD